MTTQTLAQSTRAASTDALPDLHGHLPSLDGLRGIAISLVLLCHFIPHADHPSSLAGRLFFFVSHAGWCGVDLFFVLSGFLITGILLDAKAGNTRKYFRNFYARRTLRIFPLYYGVLAVAFLLLPQVWPDLFASPEMAQLRHRQGWLWTYTSNIKMTRIDELDGFYAQGLDFNPFWSLAVEEHFYLLWPALAFFLSRRNFIRLCVGVIVASLTLRALMFWRGWSDGIYVFTPCRADALALGGLLAAMLREGGPMASGFYRRAGAWTALLGGAWLVTLVLNPERDRWWSMTFGYTLAAAFFGALLVFSIKTRPNSGIGLPFRAKFMRTLGKYSYGLYVYHVVLHGVFDRIFDQHRLADILRSRLHLGGAAYGASVILFIILASAASLAVAFASWHLFEKQILRLKKYFEYRTA